MKKIVAILLVVTLMSALFIVPAHAHEADEVTPRSMLCDDPGGCNQPMAHRTKDNGKTYTSVSSCVDARYAHSHFQYRYLKYYVCVNAICRYYNIPVNDTNYLSGQVYCSVTGAPVN